MESKLFWLGWSKEGKKGSILFWSSSDVKSGHAVCFESSVCHEVKVRKLEARLTTLSLSRLRPWKRHCSIPFRTVRIRNHSYNMSDAAGSHRYHFNCTGLVKEIAYPNKAIIQFKLNAKDERALLLSKTLTIDGKALEESRPLSAAIKVNDVIHFDCHIYDKGGVGSGKDKCNYYAMRAWKNSPEFDNKSAGGGPPTTNGAHAAHPANTKYGTGWISELNPRKGVLTFDNNGCDERVLFLASKVYFFEKRLGAKQSLNGKISVFERFSFNVLIWPNKLQ